MDDFHLRSLFLDLGCFPITDLHLYDVTFPSVLTFWRLVCTFPELKLLYLDGVKIVETAVDARTLSALRLLSAPSLTKVMPGLDPRPATDSAGLLHVFLAQTVPPLEASPWRNIRFLDLWDVTLPTAAAFGRLLCALPTLIALEIKGPCTFSGHGLNPTDVTPHPGILSRFRSIRLGKDFSLCSDPQSVRDLVDVLIQSGASRHLDHITAWLSTSLHVATGINAPFNRLVKDAGESLLSLDLRVLPQDSLPLLNEASTYAAARTACCFDISANTHLSSLVCPVDITHEGSSWLALLLELLRQVTSQPARIFWIEVAFNVKDDADLAELWPDLPSLDAALSETSFDKLRHVRIIFHNANESIDISRAAAMADACLPKLAARGIGQIWEGHKRHVRAISGEFPSDEDADKDKDEDEDKDKDEDEDDEDKF